MYQSLKSIATPGALAGLAVLLFGGFYTAGFGATGPGEVVPEGPAVLWHDPADITSRDLYYGPGGKEHEPRGSFKFEREDRNGSSPKFDIVDENGVKWRAKLGGEARPETVASRLLWAAGYFANEDYFVSSLRIQNLPRLSRGRSSVSKDGTVHNVRLKRHTTSEKKIGSWAWASNPF